MLYCPYVVLLLRSMNSLLTHIYSPYADWNEVLRETVNVLQSGCVVAVPTDTIYGIACLAQNSEAIQRIYEIKGRNTDKPLAISVGNVEDIYK